MAIHLSLATIVDDCVDYKRIDVRYKHKLNEIWVSEKRMSWKQYQKKFVENPDMMIGVDSDV